MAYSNPIFERQGLQAVDIFTSIWRAMTWVQAGNTIAWFWPLWWPTIIPLKVIWRYRGLQIVVALNKSIPDLSWLIHLCGTSLEVFETDYRQAWEDTLAREKSGSGEVVMVNIFVGKDSMSVPVLFNKSDATKNSDAETFKQLLMWYCWMQYKGGFGEVLLPRKLVRVDKVQICPTSTNNPVLGERIKTYDLGRDTSSKVVNFLKPDSLDQKQHHQTTDMLSNVDSEGLEFIRAWDRNKVSVIAVVPFAVSLLFAMIWIVVSMARYKVDAQVAVQTAFTVAAFIVTAGALLIALFAFLDDQTREA